MIRTSPASSMQKTYDQCYIICSTAVYFEKQNNEGEALRSWREALDQIYYNNAFRIPASYTPRTETEKALRDSLREMEVQCKERVDLLEALRKSRSESKQPDATNEGGVDGQDRNHTRSQSSLSTRQTPGMLGEGSVPPVNYPDLVRPSLPQRRSASGAMVGSKADRTPSNNTSESSRRPDSIPAPPNLEVPYKKTSRTPSPEKKGGIFKSTLRPQARDGARNSTGKLQMTMRSRPPTAATGAATIAWPSGTQPPQRNPSGSGSSTQVQYAEQSSSSSQIRPPSPSQFLPPYPPSPGRSSKAPPPPLPPKDGHRVPRRKAASPYTESRARNRANDAQTPSATVDQPNANLKLNEIPSSPPMSQPPKMPDFPTYRREYTAAGNIVDPKKAQEMAALAHGNRNEPKPSEPIATRRRRSPTQRHPPTIPRKAVPSADSPKAEHSKDPLVSDSASSSSQDASNVSRRRRPNDAIPSDPPSPTEDNANGQSTEADTWESRKRHILKNLPKGVDEPAARSILNEVVIKGDEVHWDDVAGLDIAKSALKEAVVYPFLRPDLFMGLREPARGMLLFGPPGTGKTMLARAVATESRSTFFSISASSLTSKFLGESEKLVRALFALAKQLAPSIIFVDEIDSLLSSRGGGGEHEATRRIKTEFLIQWSDLQKAAAGKEEKKGEGDASRVLVLAATNTPWAIDEAARRRFVRRQYIPLPEDHVRKDQLRRLMVRQKNNLRQSDYEVLVQLTDGFSGSDITALAKDAAMGPLRSLGEQLLHMSPEQIRPIGMEDFESSLVNIRPSVSKAGLKEYEDWAKEFGERGG